MRVNDVVQGQYRIVRIVNAGKDYRQIIQKLEKVGLRRTPTGRYSGIITQGPGQATGWLGILADQGVIVISDGVGDAGVIEAELSEVRP